MTDDDLTARILATIAERRRRRSQIRELAGISTTRWADRARTGEWRYSDVAAIARVLRMPVERLIGLDDRAAA